MRQSPSSRGRVAQSQFHGLPLRHGLDLCGRAGTGHRGHQSAYAARSISITRWRPAGWASPTTTQAICGSDPTPPGMCVAHAEVQDGSSLVGRHLCAAGAAGRGSRRDRGGSSRRPQALDRWLLPPGTTLQAHVRCRAHVFGASQGRAARKVRLHHFGSGVRVRKAQREQIEFGLPPSCAEPVAGRRWRVVQGDPCVINLDHELSGELRFSWLLLQLGDQKRLRIRRHGTACDNARPQVDGRSADERGAQGHDLEIVIEVLSQAAAERRQATRGWHSR